MGRRRSSRADGRLPPYVYRRPRQNLVELRRYLGDGKYGPSCSLRDDDGNTLPANASQQAIMRAYGRAVQVDNAPHTLAWLLKQKPLHKYEGDTSAAWFEVGGSGVYKMVCADYEQEAVQSWTHDGTASGLRAAVLKAALRVVG